jgi:hypothetical protein
LLRTKKELQDSQQALQRQLAEFDARIAALEASLGVTPPPDKPAQEDSTAAETAVAPQPDKPAQGNPAATVSTAALASPSDMVLQSNASDSSRGPNTKETKLGPFPYEFGKGFVLARGPNGEVDFSDICGHKLL